ncbi:translation initiation factor eIF3 subunit [Linderina pennispora]|uniref:Eukaryotic translation initiation factor 3 30 kDa subunit n=1 Tax=Linderina pennispora TaxID=61395 RepID=A0A1Y1WD79_9FUNG|nr:translation initiation factor eIF3 subunit [Linderina pennispora]ORX71479.1 translation initiation factor eIF3 subunit [Linderina pennispora]
MASNEQGSANFTLSLYISLQIQPFQKRAMSDWENEDFDDTPVVKVPKKKWDDEEEDSDSSAPDNWDNSSDESESGGRRQVQADSGAEREAKKKELLGSDDSEVDEEDIVSRKLQARRAQVASDLQNTEDLFAGLTVKDTQVADVLNTINPKTQAEFDEFRKALVERIQKTQSQRLYVSFLEGLIRELALPLKDVEVRKFSSVLTTLANEKQRAARDAAKGKKKGGKKAVVTAPPKEQLDMNDYSRDFDDFDDFM